MFSKSVFTALLFGLFLLLSSTNIMARTLDDISFEDTASIEGKSLVLNGIGIRKATFLKIKVYYGALYIATKSKDANSFLKTSDPKQIVMHFVRDVSSKDLKKTYKEAFEGANPQAATSMANLFESFSQNLVDIKKGQRMIFTFLNSGAILTVEGKAFSKIGDQKFSEALLNMWFINPLDPGLSKGLLGE